MIDKKSFGKEFIELQIKKYPYVDPAKMETTIFAFGLLDELIKNGLPFIFKGGTSLLLLLDDPKRVSTDIDIIVPIEVEFDSFFDRVKKRFPFYEGEERGDTSNPCFRHFYFMFRGPISNKECRINLDVAFEDNPYPKTLEKEVSMPFLLTRGQKTYVSIPSCESILGDKLTAFAPRTIGVNPFTTSMGKPMDNRLQVMKQFYDIARLCDFVKNMEEVMRSYQKCQRFENEFRRVSFSVRETLLDTFNAAAEVASMGLWNKKSSFYFQVARPGIQGITSNIFDGKYNQVLAVDDAAKVMLVTARLLTGDDQSCYEGKEGVAFKDKRLQCFKAVTNPKTFEIIRNSLQMLIQSKVI